MERFPIRINPEAPAAPETRSPPALWAVILSSAIGATIGYFLHTLF